jgi:hypothetical protein
VGGPNLMVAAEVVFVTSVTLGFRSCPVCGDEAGEVDGGAASAGPVGATTTAGLTPLVAVVQMMDVEGKETAVERLKTRTACNTSIVASGWVLGRLAVHAGRVVVTEQMLANSTVVCGMRLGEIPSGSSLQPP